MSIELWSNTGLHLAPQTPHHLKPPLPQIPLPVIRECIHIARAPTIISMLISHDACLPGTRSYVNTNKHSAMSIPQFTSGKGTLGAQT